MTPLESAVWILVRSFLGIFLSATIAAVAWVMSRLFLQNLPLDTTAFFITQSLVVGIPAGIGAVVAWWNPDSSPTIRIIASLLIPPATFLAAWRTVEIRDLYTYNALFLGSRRIEVIDTGDLLGTLIISSAIAANLLAAAIYIFHIIRHPKS